MSDIAPVIPLSIATGLANALFGARRALQELPADHLVYDNLRASITRALIAYETAVAAIAAQPATTPAPDVSTAASAAARGTQRPAPLVTLTHRVEVVPVPNKSYGAWSRDVVVNGHVLLNGWHHTGAQSIATKLQAALADGTPTQVTDVGNTSQHDELVANVTALANALYRLDLDGTGAVDNMLKVSAIVGNAWIDWLAEHATTAHSPTDIIRRVRQYIDDLPQDDQAVTEAHLDELRLLLSNDQD